MFPINIGFSAFQNGYGFIFFMTANYWQNSLNVPGMLSQLILNLLYHMTMLLPVPVLRYRPTVTFSILTRISMPSFQMVVFFKVAVFRLHQFLCLKT